MTLYLFASDIHGDFETFKKVFEKAKELSVDKIVFLGDYVDYGPNDVEVLLYVYKWLNGEELFGFDPKQIVFLRGNHEDLETNRNYHFYWKLQEFYRQLGKRIDVQSQIYERLPVVLYERKDKFLALHGCLPCRRNVLLCAQNENCLFEILWNDYNPNVEECAPNPRGPGIFFVGRKIWKQTKEELGVNYLFKGHGHENVDFGDGVYQVVTNNLFAKGKVIVFDSGEKEVWFEELKL